MRLKNETETFKMPRQSSKTEVEKNAALEAKKAKFKELSAARLEKAVVAISALQKLASYKPSEAQRDYILAELSKAASALNTAYSGGKATASSFAIPD